MHMENHVQNHMKDQMHMENHIQDHMKDQMHTENHIQAHVEDQMHMENHMEDKMHMENHTQNHMEDQTTIEDQIEYHMQLIIVLFIRKCGLTFASVHAQVQAIIVWDAAIFVQPPWCKCTLVYSMPKTR